MMLSISLRFVPILLEEADRIQKAQISRGSRFDGNLIQRVKHVFPIIIPLFLSTFRRADDLATAMDARCYRGGHGRTSLYELKFSRKDGVALAAIFFISLPIVLLH
jgi:energy-coupling factor transport system permease protein